MKNKVSLILIGVVLFLALALGSVGMGPLASTVEMWNETPGVLVGPVCGGGTGGGG